MCGGVCGGRVWGGKCVVESVWGKHLGVESVHGNTECEVEVEEKRVEVESVEVEPRVWGANV